MFTDQDIDECLNKLNQIAQDIDMWDCGLPPPSEALREPIRAMLAKHTAAPAVPQGWKLVPVEPTSEMLSAVGKEMSWCNPVGIFRKMLAATPATQSQHAVPMSESQRADIICAVAAICTGTSSRTVAATAIEWTERYYGIATPAAPPQPVTLTDEEIGDLARPYGRSSINGFDQMSDEQKLSEALQAGLHYAQEALDSHDMANQRHPSTEPERNAILEDIRVITEAIATKDSPAVPFDEREAFEREMRSRHGWNNSYFTQSNDGGYLSNRATYAHIGWQARAAIEKSAAKEPAVPQGEPVAWFEYNESLDAWFLAYSRNQNAKTRPLVFGDVSATPATQSQPVTLTLTHEEIRDALEAEFLGEASNRVWEDDLRISLAIIAALREKEVRK